ncbi:MAG TPA: DUF4411 family protein [Vicinamibacterales bacterium]|nr:DUF4411 family protein [Vicinamibacterales bacterium]
MSGAVWVVDSSALIQIKSFVPHLLRASVFQSLSQLVEDERLVFPHQVVKELRRDSAKYLDEACLWATEVESRACRHGVPLEDVRGVLGVVSEILDPMKDSPIEEADPYVLALALQLKRAGADARVVVQELRDTPRKLSLNTACGILGLPSVPLLGLLKTERITYQP